VPVGVLGSLAIALALACFMISMTFVFSSVLRGSMGATIAALLTYLIIFTVISGSLATAGYDPWFMPDRAGDAIAATYGISFENAFGGMMGGGGGMFGGMMRASQNPTLSFFVLVTYAVVLFGVSVWLANRREMV
jgi:ABC-type transport system involved in multi-copper enzyme maturation permease subunit